MKIQSADEGRRTHTHTKNDITKPQNLERFQNPFHHNFPKKIN